MQASQAGPEARLGWVGGVYKSPAEFRNSEAYCARNQSHKLGEGGSIEHICFVMLLSIITKVSLRRCIQSPFSSSDRDFGNSGERKATADHLTANFSFRPGDPVTAASEVYRDGIESRKLQVRENLKPKTSSRVHSSHPNVSKMKRKRQPRNISP